MVSAVTPLIVRLMAAQVIGPDNPFCSGSGNRFRPRGAMAVRSSLLQNRGFANRTTPDNWASLDSRAASGGKFGRRHLEISTRKDVATCGNTVLRSRCELPDFLADRCAS